MQYKITGSTMPVLELTLANGEGVLAESGEFSWMSDNVDMRTTTTGGAGGLMGVIGRALSGGTLLMTEYRANGGDALVAFAAHVPGSILKIDVAPPQAYMVHKHGFVCATSGVSYGMGLQRSLGARIFGGDGLFQARLTGPGRVWLQSMAVSRLAHAIAPYIAQSK